MNRLRKIFAFIIAMIISILAGKDLASQGRLTVSGYVYDKASGETLIGAGILSGNTGVVTNEYGFYSIQLPKGEVGIDCSYVGYSPITQTLKLQKDTTVNFFLIPDERLKEAVVTAHKEAGIHSATMGSIEIPIEQIRSTPTLFGEADVMKTIQLMPGVQAGMEGTSGVYVRGGGPDENLILLDGVSIYNVDHMLGLFSVFTPEAVKKVTLYKGSFPSRYSGRVSSIIDVRTNDGNMKEAHGSVSVGLLSSKVHLEGPIVKDKMSYSVSARGLHTLLFAPVIKWAGSPANYFFYDLNGKITHRFSDKDRISVSFYNGQDRLDVDYDDSWSDDSAMSGYTRAVSNDKSKIHWGNTIAAARWNHVFGGKLFLNTTAAYNRYRMGVNSDIKERYSGNGNISKSTVNWNYDSGIRDLSVKADFDYNPSRNHFIKFGAEYVYHTFLPETHSFRNHENENGTVVTDTLFKAQSNKTLHGNELSLYAEDDISIGEMITFFPGIHFSIFNTQGKTYFSPEPRISMKWALTPWLSTKAAYSRMSQYVHLLSSSQIALPTDLWVPITKDIKPVTSDIYSLGFYVDAQGGWEFSVEGYYKELHNVLEYKEGTSIIGNSSRWDEKVEMGDGRAYGVEFFARKTAGATTGSLAYTLAWSDRKFSTINSGERFPYKYDRRHTLNLSLNHRFSRKFDIGATWTFATGGTMTIPVRQSVAVDPQFGILQYDYVGSRNNYRLPASHRLNLGVNFHKMRRRSERIWNISIYNAYNAMNPNLVYTDSEYEYYNDGNYDRKIMLKKITMLPIVPSFSYTVKF